MRQFSVAAILCLASAAHAGFLSVRSEPATGNGTGAKEVGRVPQVPGDKPCQAKNSSQIKADGSTAADSGEQEGLARSTRCHSCASQRPSIPDIVIPFYERDLCKVGYTAKSLAVHDPNGALGSIILMWVSQQPATAFQKEIDKVKRSASSGGRSVKVVDFSQQVNDGHAGGWFAQQVLKLKVASLVTADFYVVMDSKNTLIRDVDAQTFFTPCNQGRVFGEFHGDSIPRPHSEWYEASARVLNLSPPTEGLWPSSITPMVMHKQTVLDMLSSIGEDPSVYTLCNGPLCDFFGAHSFDGKGATEFTMYTLFARSRVDSNCFMIVEEPSTEEPAAVSLWRGVDPHRQEQIEITLEACERIGNGRQQPFMFGAQTAALEGLSTQQRTQVVKSMVNIYTNAALHNASVTSSEALINCVAGGDDQPIQAGPVHDQPETEQPSKAFPGEAAAELGGGAYCCTATQSDSDFCGQCWPAARARKEDYCGGSEAHCRSCGNTMWCIPAAGDSTGRSPDQGNSSAASMDNSSGQNNGSVINTESLSAKGNGSVTAPLTSTSAVPDAIQTTESPAANTTESPPQQGGNSSDQGKSSTAGGASAGAAITSTPFVATAAQTTESPSIGSTGSAAQKDGNSSSEGNSSTAAPAVTSTLVVTTTVQTTESRTVRSTGSPAQEDGNSSTEGNSSTVPPVATSRLVVTTTLQTTESPTVRSTGSPAQEDDNTSGAHDAPNESLAAAALFADGAIDAAKHPQGSMGLPGMSTCAAAVVAAALASLALVTAMRNRRRAHQPGRGQAQPLVYERLPARAGLAASLAISDGEA